MRSAESAGSVSIFDGPLGAPAASAAGETARDSATDRATAVRFTRMGTPSGKVQSQGMDSGTPARALLRQTLPDETLPPRPLFPRRRDRRNGRRRLRPAVRPEPLLRPALAPRRTVPRRARADGDGRPRRTGSLLLRRRRRRRLAHGQRGTHLGADLRLAAGRVDRGDRGRAPVSYTHLRAH